ncbi:MAG TPA: hypothetical protein VN837_12475 [Chloroflexota bacterium]|nr:hypothetical protein [Chloroflexota bacterium]
MIAIVMFAFAAHVLAWIVLPASKHTSRKPAAAPAAQPTHAMGLSSI